MRLPSIVRRCVVAGLISMGVAACAHAHELAENRATLVQRDASHVTMTLFIALPEALHQVLAPERSFQDFMLHYSAMPTASFKAALLKAQTQLQAAIIVTEKNDVAVTTDAQFSLDGWVWPDAARVQAALRDKAMQALVAPDDHAHAKPFEIYAQLRSTKPITALRLQFPQALKRMMVVSYKPRQVWVEPLSQSSVITFP